MNMSISMSMSILPTEIIHKIISYTYCPQPKFLTEDIISFYVSKQVCNFLYYDYWIIQMGNETLEDKYWLLTNLYNYINKIPFIFNRVFTRMYNINHVNKFYNKTDIKTQINIIFGLMTPLERNTFLNTS